MNAIPHYCYYKIRLILLIVSFKEKFLLRKTPHFKSSEIGYVIKMRCVILINLAQLKRYWQNALLLGMVTVEKKKSATFIANFTLFYNGIMVSLSLVAGSVETISIIKPCGKQMLVCPGLEIQPVFTAI